MSKDIYTLGKEEWERLHSHILQNSSELIERLERLYLDKTYKDPIDLHVETDFLNLIEDIKACIVTQLGKMSEESWDIYSKHFIFELCRHVRKKLELSEPKVHGKSIFEIGQDRALPDLPIDYSQHVVPKGCSFSQETVDRIIKEVERSNYSSLQEVV